MEDRYPFIRFIIDAGQVIAGAVALIVLLSGTVHSCHHGGVGGLIGFLVVLAVAAVVYVVVMVKIEVLRVVLDIESNTRQTTLRPPAATPPASGGTPGAA